MIEKKLALAFISVALLTGCSPHGGVAVKVPEAATEIPTTVSDEIPTVMSDYSTEEVPTETIAAEVPTESTEDYDTVTADVTDEEITAIVDALFEKHGDETEFSMMTKDDLMSLTWCHTNDGYLAYNDSEDFPIELECSADGEYLEWK